MSLPGSRSRRRSRERGRARYRTRSSASRCRPPNTRPAQLGAAQGWGGLPPGWLVGWWVPSSPCRFGGLRGPGGAAAAGVQTCEAGQVVLAFPAARHVVPLRPGLLPGGAARGPARAASAPGVPARPTEDGRDTNKKQQKRRTGGFVLFCFVCLLCFFFLSRNSVIDCGVSPQCGSRLVPLARAN